MKDQITKIEETLKLPDEVVESNTDSNVELYYRKYTHTLVGEKY